MKFLLYSSTEVPDASSTGIANALERLGHGVSRWQRPRRTPLEFPIRDIADVARLYKIDAFVFFGGIEVRPEHIQLLKNEFPHAAFIMWNFDVMTVPDTWVWFERLARQCDLSIQMDMSEPEKWQGINRIYCRMGIDPQVEKPYLGGFTDEEHAKYAADVAFMGMAYDMGGRKRTLDLVQDWCRQTGRIFKLWGLWTEYLVGTDLAKMIALTKIHLGHEPDGRPPGHWSQRVYTILAHGGFYLAKWVPGYETQFIDEHHLKFWHSEDQLIAVLSQYLESPPMRRELVEFRGYQYVRQECTWDQRVASVMQNIEEIARAKR